ncbi:YoaK family protein [Streptomyces sp. NPDC006208]|uniref:YoaK family protein n=1 Tax=Streptomyces sp. NPDC006208 TaxID=3156734 RepID=UPI0033B7E525
MEPSPRALTPLLIVLTLSTGVVEAACFLQLGPVFTAMQTGNVLLFAFGAAGEGGLSTMVPAVSLGSFAVGTVIGARMEPRLEARTHRWLVLALMVEGLLISAAGFTAWGLVLSPSTTSARQVLVTAVLAVAMGMRNVTTMRAHVPALPTTLVTTSTTTALLSSSPFGHDPAIGHRAGAAKRRSASILAMFVGGLIGAYLIHLGWSVSALLFLAAAVVLATTVVYARQPNTTRGEDPPARE